MSDINNIQDNITNDNINESIILRPCIDENNICYSSDNKKILNCVLSDNGDIKGITEDNIKALYIYSDNKWLFGRDIGKYNLIDLSNRSVEERQRLGSIGGKKAKENRDKQKNINELAKAMLDQALDDKTIKTIIGDNPNFMQDKTLGSAMLNQMIISALNGSFKAFEAVRDTAGYKPKNEIDIQADIMTDNDKALIDKALKTG